MGTTVGVQLSPASMVGNSGQLDSTLPGVLRGGVERGGSGIMRGVLREGVKWCVERGIQRGCRLGVL